jgi:hypothetical protein
VGPPAPAQRPPDRPGGGRRTGRRWLAALVLLLLLAAGAYLAAVQLMARTGTAPPPSTQVPPATTTGRPAGCAWTEPTVGTQDRVRPLDAMRARLGVSGQLAGVEMRLFTGPGGLKRWYVKAYQQDDSSKQGRFLVDEQADGPPQVVAEADYDTRGYRRADWRPVGAGVRGPAALLAGCLAGT